MPRFKYLYQFSRLSLSIQLIIFSLGLAGARPVSAQCPGVSNVTGNLAYWVSKGPGTPGPLYDFIGTGCTTAMFGPNPPTGCFVGQLPPPFFSARLAARWSDAAHNLTENGCTFNCEMGSCRIRGFDALPVELMDFSVESSEADAADTTGSDGAADSE